MSVSGSFFISTVENTKEVAEKKWEKLPENTTLEKMKALKEI